MYYSDALALTNYTEKANYNDFHSHYDAITYLNAVFTGNYELRGADYCNASLAGAYVKGTRYEYTSKTSIFD